MSCVNLASIQTKTNPKEWSPVDTLRHTCDSVFVFSVAHDQKLKYFDLNTVFDNVAGPRTDLISGRPLDECFSPEVARTAADNCLRCVETGRPISYEETIAHGGGARTWSITLTPIRDALSHIDRILGVCVEAKDLKGRGEELAQSDRLFERLAEAVPSIVYVLDLDTQKLDYLNESGLQIIQGQEGNHEASLSELVSCFVHTDDQALVLKHFQSARSLVMQGRAQMEFRIRHRDGSYHWYADCYAPFRLAEDSTVTQIVGVLSDMSEQREALKALAENEKRSQLIADAVQEILFAMDSAGRVEFCNRAVSEFCGLCPSKISGHRWWKLIHCNDRKALRRIISNDRPVECEVRLKGKGGVYRWFLVRARPIWNSDRTVGSWLGSATDIDDLKRVQADLQSANRRIQMTESAISDAYITLDRNYLVTSLNQHAADWLLSSREAVLGSTILSKLHWNVEDFQRYVADVMVTGVALSKEVKSFVRRGRWIDLHVCLIDDGVAVIVRDITDRKANEAATRNSLHVLQHSIDALSAHISVLDESGRIIAINRTWRSYNEARDGRSGLGETCFDFYTKLANQADIDGIGKGLTTVLSGEKHSFRHVFKCGTPSSEWFQLRASGFQASGQAFVVVTHEDISAVKNLAEERRRINSQLLRTQNAERQRIARDLHDSTAQHIAAIGLGLARLKKCANEPDVEGVLADIDMSLQEAHNELRSMIYLLHPPYIEGCNIVTAFQNFIDGFAKRTKLKVELDCPPEILVSPDEKQVALYRVVQEALVNANRYARANEVVVRLRATPNAVQLEVKDDGIGLPPEALNGGKSSGLGILGMRARMEEFGGSFSIRPLARGTKVRATMPIDKADHGSIK